MKKLLAILLITLISVSSSLVIAAPADIAVYVDNKLVDYDVNPVIIDSRTMVPIRKTAEVFGAEVSWDDDTKTATITYGDRVVKMTQDDPDIYINDIRIGMDTSAVNVDSRILIPVRYLAEALDASVFWDNNLRKVEVVTNRHYVTIDDKKITLGHPISSVKRIFGEPDRIDSGSDRFEWYVYNNLSGILMVGVLDNKVISIYTAFNDFCLNDGIKYGDLLDSEISSPEFTLFTDKLNGDTIYGVWVGKAYSTDKFLRENFSSASLNAELEISDITNAFRVKNNLGKLKTDETAVKVCRAHSQDMANNNYSGHTNLKGESPWDRYDKAGGKYYACTESISTAQYSPIMIFDSWMNSEDHRSNLLHEKATFAGVGIGYSEDSEHGFYATQMFSYKK